MKRSRALSVSALTEEDLTAIYRWYLKRANVDAAERFLVAFEQACSRLSSSSDPGRLRQFRHAELAGIRSALLSRPYDNYLIFFRAEERSLTVVRVLHGMRDLEPLLAKGMP